MTEGSVRQCFNSRAGGAPLTVSNWLFAIILGLVQGVSEWLPVSSKTQIILVSQNLLGLNFQQAYTFGLFLEIGTALAAIVYFRKEVWMLIRALVGKGNQQEWELFKFTLVATVATGLVAVPIYVSLDNVSGGYNIGLPMMILGVVLFIDAGVIMYSRSRYADDKNRRALDHLGVKEYVIIGVAQGLAALPGVSRSGTTTSTMLLLNVEAKEAFRLSFIIGILASAAASAVTLVFSRQNVAVGVSDLGTAGILISIGVAFVVSLLLIDSLLKVARKAKIVYLIVALGAIAIAGGLVISFFPLGFNAG
ncbi:MAG: undecaprenyl-diphosphate phosphatase [Nitrososphaerota archaeon]|nr:undecaprenyl-diphosphate phosphatase [Nitrososphaerota archaeon]